MAKIELWESDVVEGIYFEYEEDMRNFDKKIVDDDYYIEVAKEYLDDYDCQKRIYCIGLVKGNIEISAKGKLVDIIKDQLKYNYICDTEFEELTRELYDDDEIANDKITKYIYHKLESLEEKINGLAYEKTSSIRSARNKLAKEPLHKIEKTVV